MGMILGRGAAPLAARADATLHSVVVASRVPTKRRRENCMLGRSLFGGSEANRPFDAEGAEGVGRQQLCIAGPRRRGIEHAGGDKAGEMLVGQILAEQRQAIAAVLRFQRDPAVEEIGRASGRERGWKYG